MFTKYMCSKFKHKIVKTSEKNFKSILAEQRGRSPFRNDGILLGERISRSSIG